MLKYENVQQMKWLAEELISAGHKLVIAVK
ncbi:hypothetical protein CHFL109739_06400 [Chryseobacterium flavum]